MTYYRRLDVAVFYSRVYNKYSQMSTAEKPARALCDTYKEESYGFSNFKGNVCKGA